MNRDDVTRMAREAFIKRGFWPNEVMWECWKDAWIQGAAAERNRAWTQEHWTEYERSIAAAAKAEEREAIRQVAEREMSNTSMLLSMPPKSSAAWNILQAINARGQA